MKLSKPACLEAIGASDTLKKPLFCVHGLNQRPSALKLLLFDLSGLGYQPYLMHMPGHDGQSKYKSLSADDYNQTYQDCYSYICENHEMSPHFFGYSFGGLLGVRNFADCPFKKMLLLAPALSVRYYTFLLKPLLPFLKRIHSLPFGNREYDEHYRFHQDGVPVEIYQSFFKVYQEYREMDHKAFDPTNALLLSHPGDELVSFQGLKKIVQQIEGWNLEALSNTDAEFSKFKHLCIDKTTLGEESYFRLLARIERYFSEKKEHVPCH